MRTRARPIKYRLTSQLRSHYLFWPIWQIQSYCPAARLRTHNPTACQSPYSSLLSKGALQPPSSAMQKSAIRAQCTEGEFVEMQLTSANLHAQIKKAAPLGTAFKVSFLGDHTFLRRFAATRPPSPANNIQPAAGSGTVPTGVPAR